MRCLQEVRMNRRWIVVVCLLVVLECGIVGRTALAANEAGCTDWPMWSAFKEDFLQADGRVIDYSAAAHSTSEGQAYTLFFALLANDRAAFDQILTWTESNLAEGELSSRLMAWRWGQRADGSWGVIDRNAASDADVWLAYTLYQAGRLWKDPALSRSAAQVRARIERDLVVTVPGIGLVLVPGAQGFRLQAGGWKLNPSYLPLQVLKGLAHEAPDGPWQRLAHTTLNLFDAVTPHHLAPDWVAVHPGQGFRLTDSVSRTGSYDAIRVYLWAGMMSDRDPDKARLLRRLTGMRSSLASAPAPPERVDALTGEMAGIAPIGFSAALLPYLDSLGARDAAHQQRQRLAALQRAPKAYFERVLVLFGLGWWEKRFRFDRDGQFLPGCWGS